MFVGFADGSNPYRLCLYKRDAGVNTLLATKAGYSFSTNYSGRVDMQLSGYGASPVVNVYLNGVLLISYSGALPSLACRTLTRSLHTTSIPSQFTCPKLSWRMKTSGSSSDSELTDPAPRAPPTRGRTTRTRTSTRQRSMTRTQNTPTLPHRMRSTIWTICLVESSKFEQ